MSDTKSKTVKENVNSPGHYNKIILSNIKHDLINPINAILGYSELIMDISHIENNKPLKRDIQTIHDSGNTILTHINEIFSIDSYSDDDNVGKIIHNTKLQFILRTPLSTIMGLTEMVMDDLITLSDKNLKDVKESLEKIRDAGKRLFILLNDLKGYVNYSADELMEKYKPDIYSKEASNRLFDFSPNVKVTTEPGVILVVDDEVSNLELLEKIIKQSNHTVFKAENASRAMKILSDNSNHIDLILLDLIMPGLNGIQLLQKLKADSKTCHIPVIMQSALDELEAIVECITLGADDFLMKPINKVLLKAKLNSTMEKKHLRDKEIKYQNKIKQEQKKSETLLLNILPGSIARRLKDGETLIADDYKNATVLFADLSGFTAISAIMSAKDLVMLLNNVFSVFDELLIKHSLEKIKTIGDNYMLAGGIPQECDNHAISVAEMALDMLDVVPKIKTEMENSLQIRIGINSGPVSAGVIGKKKFIYDLWGDTVNIASRMESYGINGRIHIAEETYKILKDLYKFKKCKIQEIPGKGKMQTYYLTGRL